MIDVQNETVINFTEASLHLPGNPCYATLQRWKARTSNPLEVVKIGGRIFTSLEALERFAQRCTDPTSKPVNTRSRQKAIDRADKELAAEGI